VEGQNVNLVVALVAGVLSFFSPCVLPLVPIYLGYMTGTIAGAGERPQRLLTLTHALCFVLGFTLVMVLLGVAAGLLGSALAPILPTLIKIGGVVLIIFGLHMTGLIAIPLLNMEKRLELRHTSSGNFGASFLVGVVFSAGWTPCVGPVLSAILTLAASTQTAGQGALLLACYALGLGVPFLVVAALLDLALPLLRRLGRALRLVSVIGGALLIVMGFLLLTGLFEPLTYWLASAVAGG
jgi:cytochrome c-type biogenesis protein